jgi:DNA-directed RNA polymerase subunit H (RpoH/RPB5)
MGGVRIERQAGPRIKMQDPIQKIAKGKRARGMAQVVRVAA